MAHSFFDQRNKLSKCAVILSVILLSLYSPVLGQKTSAEDTKRALFFSKADTFLSENVQDGKVAYRAIQQSPKLLNNLVKMIGNVSLDEASAKQKKAFYINAYNILTIDAIIDHEIPSSPLDVEGFFDEIQHLVAGKRRTLDNIEKDILLPTYKDARIHFAIVCAAKGCPHIRPEAYKPSKIAQQLKESAVKTLSSDYFIRLDKDSVRVSEIFKWYEQDFLRESQSVIDYINQYRSEKIPADYEVGYYKYDWSLNAANF